MQVKLRQEKYCNFFLTPSALTNLKAVLWVTKCFFYFYWIENLSYWSERMIWCHGKCNVFVTDIGCCTKTILHKFGSWSGRLLSPTHRILAVLELDWRKSVWTFTFSGCKLNCSVHLKMNVFNERCLFSVHAQHCTALLHWFILSYSSVVTRFVHIYLTLWIIWADGHQQCKWFLNCAMCHFSALASEKYFMICIKLSFCGGWTAGLKGHCLHVTAKTQKN